MVSLVSPTIQIEVARQNYGTHLLVAKVGESMHTSHFHDGHNPEISPYNVNKSSRPDLVGANFYFRLLKLTAIFLDMDPPQISKPSRLLCSSDQDMPIFNTSTTTIFAFQPRLLPHHKPAFILDNNPQ